MATGIILNDPQSWILLSNNTIFSDEGESQGSDAKRRIKLKEILEYSSSCSALFLVLTLDNLLVFYMNLDIC